eukprot:c21592_g1_i2 orf=500-1333(-)
MGSSPSCLSNGLVHHAAEEDAELIRVVRSTDGELFQYPGPVFVKDLMSGFQGFAVFAHNYKSRRGLCDRPLHPDTELLFRRLYHLKPLLKPSIKQADSSKPTHTGSNKGYTSLPEEERSAKKPAGVVEEKVKVKKVRFADEAILISSSDSVNPRSKMQNGEEVSGHKTQSTEKNEAMAVRASSVGGVLEEEVSSLREESGYKVKGVVRLKVVISKKQLTELMSPTTTEKQADALMEKMIAPLLSPQSSSNKSEALMHNGALISPTWRPSLEHIPEDE